MSMMSGLNRGNQSVNTGIDLYSWNNIAEDFPLDFPSRKNRLVHLVSGIVDQGFQFRYRTAKETFTVKSNQTLIFQLTALPM